MAYTLWLSRQAGKTGCAAPAVSAPRVVRPPGEALQSGPEHQHIRPAQNAAEVLAREEVRDCTLWHLLLLYKFAFLVLGLPFPSLLFLFDPVPEN